MPLIVSIILGFFPAFIFALILYWLDRYEKEPGLLLGAVFIWGAVVAAFGAFLINTLLGVGVFIFTNSEVATEMATGSLIAPITEEIFKGLAVLMVFLIFRKEFDSIIDGIIYAGVTALGFAATENAYYIYTLGYLETGWSGLGNLTFIRIFLVGWQHPFFTSFIGIGLAISRLNKHTWMKISAPLAGLGLSIFTHSIHNTLIAVLDGISGLTLGAIVDWTGWFLMFCFMLFVLHRERELVRNFLAEEVTGCLITPLQYKISFSPVQQSLKKISSLFQGNFRNTNHFYQVCAELAHKKSQLLKYGDEQGNKEIISALVSELSRLSPLVK